jgi:hypothetical protein
MPRSRGDGRKKLVQVLVIPLYFAFNLQ